MILLLGIPGSGKGTQGKLLADTRGYHIISTGELLRTYGSDEQHQRMKTGEILGDEEVTELLDKALSHLENQDKVILDGYPRTVSQAQWLMDSDKKDRFQIRYVLHLQASREAVKARLRDRARPDDNENAVEERFNEYERKTFPLIDYFNQNGVEIVEVNGEGDIETIHKDIVAIDRERNPANSDEQG